MEKKSKIFLMEWSTDVLSQAALELKNRGVEIMYWMSGRLAELPLEKFPGTVFHNTFDAFSALPPYGINDSEFDPLSRDILEKLYNCESQALLMMQRLHMADDLSGIPFQKRKLFYLKYVKYWLGILKKMEPDALVFAESPHMVCDFIAYHIAKILGIKTLMFEITKAPDRLLVFNDIEENSLDLIKEYEIINQKGTAKLEDLSKEIQDYYLELIKGKEIYYPFSQREPEKMIYLPKASSIIRQIKQGALKIKLRDYFKKVKTYKRLRVNLKRANLIKSFHKEYFSLQTEPDLKKKFVFVASHYQPENSTCPMAGVFADQVLMIDILSSALPSEWLLYFKEHPSQFQATKAYQGRHSGYYQKLAQYKNLRLIPTSIPSSELIFHSQATATSTGTAGWEALLKGKPALIFGFPFFMHCEGVFRISNFEECKKAFLSIQNGYNLNQQKVLNFLVALDKVSIKARLGIGYEKKTYVSDQESSLNIAQSILKELTI